MIKLNCDIGEGYDDFDKEAFKYSTNDILLET